MNGLQIWPLCGPVRLSTLRQSSNHGTALQGPRDTVAGECNHDQASQPHDFARDRQHQAGEPLRVIANSMLAGGAVIADERGWLPHLSRWCGLALMAAGLLLVAATLLHPSRETATTIVATEPRLVGGACGSYSCLVADAAWSSRT
jgi:hypothetical protein